jgi:glucan phosphoethanolaminetransferase (alkaline phosphatase superfamily)
MGLGMQAKLFSALGKVAGLAGIAFGVFLLLFQGVIANIFSLSQDQAFRTVVALMIFTFGIAGIGVIAWLVGKTVEPERPIPPSTTYILASLVTLIVCAAVYAAVAGAQDKKTYKICWGEGVGGRFVERAQL